jgi:hypothetical protein
MIVSAISVPADAATARVASRQRLHLVSVRATSSQTTIDPNASAVYCLRSLRMSIAGDSSAAAAVASPAVNRVSPSSRPSRYAADTARPAKINGTSRCRSRPPWGTRRSSRIQPSGVVAASRGTSDSGARTESITHASSSQYGMDSQNFRSCTKTTMTPAPMARMPSTTLRPMPAVVRGQDRRAGGVLPADAPSTAVLSSAGLSTAVLSSAGWSSAVRSGAVLSGTAASAAVPLRVTSSGSASSRLFRRVRYVRHNAGTAISAR